MFAFRQWSLIAWKAFGLSFAKFRLSYFILVFICVLQGCCVGLYFVNRPEWLIVDHACSAYSFISVPLYDTLGQWSENHYFIIFLRWIAIKCKVFSVHPSGPEAVKYIVNHAAVQAIFCVPQTLNIVSSQHDWLKDLIVLWITIQSLWWKKITSWVLNLWWLWIVFSLMFMDFMWLQLS